MSESRKLQKHYSRYVYLVKDSKHFQSLLYEGSGLKTHSWPFVAQKLLPEFKFWQIFAMSSSSRYKKILSQLEPNFLVLFRQFINILCPPGCTGVFSTRIRNTLLRIWWSLVIWKYLLTMQILYWRKITKQQFASIKEPHTKWGTYDFFQILQIVSRIL